MQVVTSSLDSSTLISDGSPKPSSSCCQSPFHWWGGIWLVWLLGYNLSVAVAVGFIALAGVAAEMGVVMLIYLDHAWDAIKAKRASTGDKPTVTDLYSSDGRCGGAACGQKS